LPDISSLLTAAQVPSRIPVTRTTAPGMPAPTQALVVRSGLSLFSLKHDARLTSPTIMVRSGMMRLTTEDSVSTTNPQLGDSEKVVVTVIESRLPHCCGRMITFGEWLNKPRVNFNTVLRPSRATCRPWLSTTSNTEPTDTVLVIWRGQQNCQLSFGASLRKQGQLGVLWLRSRRRRSAVFVLTFGAPTNS
jgi:hypothetical protein